MNDNLIFMHLPKNGGTTFHSILNRLYPKKNTFTIQSVTNIKTNRDEFIKMKSTERNKINLLKGHMPFGFHEYMKNGAKYVTFLRKPEDRIISFYYYVLRKPKNKLYNRIINSNMDLYDFVTQVESHDLNNCQVRWISGIDDKEEFMLEKALENIENHFSFVGITELYNESLIALQKKYNWSMPYYEVKNKTKNRKEKKEIDQKTIDAINHYNNADIQLYKIIYDRFLKQLDSIDNLSFKLYKLSLTNKLYTNKQTRKIIGSFKKRIK